MKIISEINNQTFEEERSLYNVKNTLVKNCVFSGPKDGESPLKEAKNIVVENSKFDLRYSFWHVEHGEVKDCKFTNLARAPFWYCDDVTLIDVKSDAVKIFRECKNVKILDSTFISEEPFWRCDNLDIKNIKLSGFYAFFESNNVKIENLDFTGKYSFQYNNHLRITNSKFDTKDAFWHCKNVVVENSVIKGEYIGWYGEDMTFINCTIESHQPFCYTKNLKFVDCKMPNCDLAFENSTVSGNILGKLDSIKNPIKCDLVVGKVKEIIKENPINNVEVNIKEQKSTL